MINGTSVYDILSLIDGILYNKKGMATLCSLFITSPLVIPYVTLCKRIFKTEKGYFKMMDTVNVDFIDSELPDEQVQHITPEKNDSLK